MNVFEHIDKTDAELEKLTTRHLNEIRKRSYIRNVCSCASGGGQHCGDDVLTEEERAENVKMRAFNKRLLAILATREHVPSGKAARQAAAKKGR
jgi:hypothetical protein